jgi:lactate racemase
MKIKVPLGHSTQELVLPDERVLGVCLPGTMAPASDPRMLLQRGIAGGLESSGIASKAAIGRLHACIIVSDRTRSTPIALIVPVLLDQLNALGVADDHITVVNRTAGRGEPAHNLPQPQAFHEDPRRPALRFSDGCHAA